METKRNRIVAKRMAKFNKSNSNKLLCAKAIVIKNTFCFVKNWKKQFKKRIKNSHKKYNNKTKCLINEKN